MARCIEIEIFIGPNIKVSTRNRKRIQVFRNSIGVIRNVCFDVVRRILTVITTEVPVKDTSNNNGEYYPQQIGGFLAHVIWFLRCKHNKSNYRVLIRHTNKKKSHLVDVTFKIRM